MDILLLPSAEVKRTSRLDDPVETFSRLVAAYSGNRFREAVEHRQRLQTLGWKVDLSHPLRAKGRGVGR